MDNLIRLLLRFLIVPLGFLAATIVGSLVIMIASWQLIGIATGGDPDGPSHALFAALLGSAILLPFVLVMVLLPASIGILLSEGFAIRSWIFHAPNGMASAWLGWKLYEQIAGKSVPLDQPLIVVAAGIAGGFAYWAVAGWNAGFWKPVFASGPVPQATPPATTPR